ncbi:hypothetical protein TorRG33x02_156010, partial [Trema orientale]
LPSGLLGPQPVLTGVASGSAPIRAQSDQGQHDKSGPEIVKWPGSERARDGMYSLPCHCPNNMPRHFQLCR